MKETVTEVVHCCSRPLKVMHISLTGAWVALYVYARLMEGRCLLSEEESTTSCMSSLLTPTLRLVSSFLHCISYFATQAELQLEFVSHIPVITLHCRSQVPTCATGRQIQMETAATSASRPQTHRGCVAVRMA